MSMASGTIGSSLVDGYYRTNEQCAATIAMSMGPVYLLLAYDLENESTCSFDSISFGQKKFCGKGTHLFRSMLKTLVIVGCIISENYGIGL